MATKTKDRPKSRPSTPRGTTRATTKSGGMSASKRDGLESRKFAFPKQRKEPINDAKHVRNAVARFDQVEGVTDRERDSAWRRIKRAAKKYSVDISERSWRELGKDDTKGAKKRKKGKAKAGKS